MDKPGTPVEEREPCNKCRSTARAFSLAIFETVSVKTGIDLKKKSPAFPSKKKLRVHLQQGDQIDHRTGKWVLKERRIDKDASPAWYFELITDPDTGKELHRCSEPLDKHRGHGSAKKNPKEKK